METARLTLFTAALITAVGTTTSSPLTSITNTGYPIFSGTSYSLIEVNVCDLDLASGIQCSIQVSPTMIVGAYMKNSSTRIYRP